MKDVKRHGADERSREIEQLRVLAKKYPHEIKKIVSETGENRPLQIGTLISNQVGRPFAEVAKRLKQKG